MAREKVVSAVHEILSALHKEWPLSVGSHAFVFNPETNRVSLSVAVGSKWYTFEEIEDGDFDDLDEAIEIMKHGIAVAEGKES